MPAAPLKKLTVEAFRGSTGKFELDFEKGRKLTLIYGENASGKTTICDAFEFLASEKVGSIEERGMGAALHKYWPAAGKSASAVRVELESTGGAKCSGTIGGKKAVVIPIASRPRIELLRQRQILDLVQAQPGKRYEKIRRFIDIAAFETSEENLRKLATMLDTQKGEAALAEGEHLGTLQGNFELAGKPDGFNAVTWAKDRISQPVDSLHPHITAISSLRTRYAALEALPERVEERRQALANANSDLAAAETGLSQALAAAADGAGEALPVLQAGRDYLHAHADASECPLCGSAEKMPGLAAAIDAKLQALAAITTATAARDGRQGVVASAQATVSQAEADLGKAVDAFVATIEGHQWRDEVKRPATNPPKDAAVLKTWLVGSASIAASWPEVEAAWRQEQAFLASLKLTVEAYDSNLSRREELEALIPRIKKALDECVAERKDFIDGILTNIAGDVGKLYEVVHPGEGLDKIALPLDPRQRASMELMAEFAGEEVPPQAYFSQSHLDTLGLCVFLALALRGQPADTILILDDVLGSVDEPHVARVIEMLYGVSVKFQHTIVTTHYRPWREKFRWGFLKPDQPCQFVELLNWDIEQGIRSTLTRPEADRLRTLLGETTIDTQTVCGKAGVILEAVLDHLTQKYECSLPRRPGAAYTLGDLLNSIGWKLREALKVDIRDGLTDPSHPPKEVVPLRPIIDKLQNIAQARNALGAHFKPGAFDLLDTDGIDFAKEVLNLHDALVHPEHGWPTNDESGSYWRNSGDSRRLHPLQKPG